MKSDVFHSRARRLLALLALGLPLTGLSAETKHLLVVTATKGFRHSSIPTAERILKQLGADSGVYDVEYVRGGADGKDDTDVKEKLAPDSLRKYDGVIFANTTGDLAIPDKEFFLEWLKSGKAFVGMHSCSDTYHGYPAFIQMLGGEFLNHHEQVKIAALNQDNQHPATQHLGPAFEVFDEIYLFKNFNREQVHGLLWLDKHPNKGNPGDFAVSWCKEYGKGRVFYTSLGHREDVWDADPNLKDRRNSTTVSKAYQQHILGGIQWALGLKSGSGTPQGTKASLSPQEAAEGYQLVFNGSDLTGWHYRNPNGLQSWSAQNGMLVNTIPPDKHGTDLITDRKFTDFTARYEYMVPKGANSGFYLRGRYEVQVFDDGDATQPSNSSNGALYSQVAPSKMVSKKAGEWQTVEATIKGNKVSVILNGEKIIDNATVDRPTGGELDNKVNEPGPIFVQGDHGQVAFRNIRVKELK